MERQIKGFKNISPEEVSLWSQKLKPQEFIEFLKQEISLNSKEEEILYQKFEALSKKRSLESLDLDQIIKALDEKLIAHGIEPPLKLTPNAIQVLERRYLKKDKEGRVIERPKDMFLRVAKTIAEAEKKYHKDPEPLFKKFYHLMTSLKFIPNSPTLMNAGRELGQLSACFVIEVQDSMESIFQAIKDTALIHKSGGGTGFSFSRIRPANDVVASTKGVSSGPLSFMRVFDAATETIKQGGTRRGANMGILNIDHPDIIEFITAKSSQKQLTNFNISVGITEDFLKKVAQEEDYDLINPRTKKIVGKKNAKKIFDLITALAWKNGEPGIIFIDRLNKDNPTPHLGKIEGTNPCGEQPLLPYESCNLGSINLSKMVKNKKIMWEELKETVHLAVHFLDNVIDVTKFPLEKIKEMTKKTRKIGLGVMGLADMLIKLEIPYDSEEAIALGEKIMKFIQTEARIKSAQLARERGVFPSFKGSIYDKKDGIPLRNATTTTIAPTGTISIIAGCSSGIEPIFAVVYTRNVLDGTKLYEINPLFKEIAEQEGFLSEALIKKISQKGSLKEIEEIPQKWRRLFVTAHDISPEWHVKMQAAFQKYTDNAVSKTVNFPAQATQKDIADAFWLAYKLGCKGITVYRDKSRDEQVLSIQEKTKEEKISFQRPKIRERPELISGITQKMSTGCGNLYVTINEDEHGPFEVFTTIGKAGGCAASQAEAVSRLISLSLRAGIDFKYIVEQLQGVRCPLSIWKHGVLILSCADALAKAIKKYLDAKQGKIKDSLKKKETDESQINPAFSGEMIAAGCPDCGGPLEHESGCILCRLCGFSKCA
jgi:ribonucleoside-diphosphate reductase alpha chain